MKINRDLKKLEKEVKSRVKMLQSNLNQKQTSHLRELTIKFYGKIIGHVAWNLLLLLYQSGSMYSSASSRVKTEKRNGSETKMLIKQMATKKRTTSAPPKNEELLAT